MKAELPQLRVAADPYDAADGETAQPTERPDQGSNAPGVSCSRRDAP